MAYLPRYSTWLKKIIPSLGINKESLKLLSSNYKYLIPSITYSKKGSGELFLRKARQEIF